MHFHFIWYKIVPMELFERIGNYIDGRALISISGSGGKTTLMEELGYYLKGVGYSVLLTTTTKVASPVFHNYKTDYVYSDSSVFAHDVKKGESVFYASSSYDTKKWVSPDLDEIGVLSKLYDVVIYESDGSRGLPLKYHSQRDPVILDHTDICISVMGIWGVGEIAYKMCFGDGSERIIDKEYLDEYLSREDGMTKLMDISQKRVLLFNGSDAATDEQLETLRHLNIPSGYDAYIISEKENRIYETL